MLCDRRIAIAMQASCKEGHVFHRVMCIDCCYDHVNVVNADKDDNRLHESSKTTSEWPYFMQ